MTIAKKLTAAIAVAAASISTPTFAASILVGWETWADSTGDINPATQIATGFTGSGDGTAEAGGSWFRFNNAMVTNGASNDGTFGTVATPAANTSVSNLGDGYALSNGFDGFIDFTVFNGSGSPVELASFNFDSGAFRARAATDWELSVQPGGAVTSGSVTTGGPVTVASAPITDDYDIDLTGLADNELEAGGTVVFRLEFTGGEAPGTTSSGHHLFLDNVAVFGEIIPEPTSAALLGLGLLGLLRRRRTS